MALNIDMLLNNEWIGLAGRTRNKAVTLQSSDGVREILVNIQPAIRSDQIRLKACGEE